MNGWLFRIEEKGWGFFVYDVFEVSYVVWVKCYVKVKY